MTLRYEGDVLHTFRIDYESDTLSYTTPTSSILVNLTSTHSGQASIETVSGAIDHEAFKEMVGEGLTYLQRTRQETQNDHHLDGLFQAILDHVYAKTPIDDNDLRSLIAAADGPIDCNSFHLAASGIMLIATLEALQQSEWLSDSTADVPVAHDLYGIVLEMQTDCNRYTTNTSSDEQ